MSTASGDETAVTPPHRGGVFSNAPDDRRRARMFLVALLVLDALLLIFGPHFREHTEDIKVALAAGKRPDWWDDAAVGIHCAAWINAVLLVVLLLTTKWWTRSLSQISNLRSQISSPRWFWPLTIMAVLTCFALRYPLASKSLWWDEAWVIQQVSHGKWKADSKKPDALKFQVHDWTRCAWYYQKPTNHVPMSLLQKASITTGQKLTGAKRERFTDLAARVPALLASCVAVGLMACLLRAWGRPGAGVVAAFLLAAHPWAIRYGVDARAYALVIPLCISGMFAITKIVASRGSKAWEWAWWGVTEFLWLWAFPNAVIDIAALNILCAWLLWRSVEKADRGTVMMRLVVTNAFAAMCFIQMFLPNVMQARRWVGQEADKHVLDLTLLRSAVSQAILGIEYEWPDIPESAGLLSVRSTTFWGGGSLMLIVAILLPFWLVVRRGSLGCFGSPRNVAISLTPLLSGVAFATLTLMAGTYFYPRFAIGVLPTCVIWLALACVVGYQRMAKRVSLAPRTNGNLPFAGNSPESVSACVMALLLWSIGMPFVLQIRVLASRPYAPLHDVATYVQSQAKSAKPLIACYGLGREVMPVYEPSCLPVENAAGVEALMQKAKAEHRPLYLIYGYNSFNRSMLADGFKLLDDKSLFEEVKAFPGIEPEFYFRVLKAK